MSKVKRKLILVIIPIAGILLLGLLIWISNPYFKAKDRNIVQQSKCLSDNEVATYPLEVGFEKYGFLAESTKTKISIKDKASGNEKSSFEITDVLYSGTPIEIHKCAVYVQKEFDVKKPTWRREIWRYAYDGKGEKLFTIAEYNEKKEKVFYYSSDFRASNDERYMVLRKVVDPDNGIGYFVFKDLNYEKDIFSLPLSDIASYNFGSYVNFDGFGRGWTKNDKYFWARIPEGSDIHAFIRVNTENWTFEVISAPKGTMGGDKLNVEKGFITYRSNAAPWTGDSLADERFREQAIKNNSLTYFNAYDLFNKKSYQLASTNDPVKGFDSWWISDTELEYYLPSGERKIFKIPE